MPLVYGYHLRWSLIDAPCTDCGESPKDWTMVEVKETGSILCKPCLGIWRARQLLRSVPLPESVGV